MVWLHVVRPAFVSSWLEPFPVAASTELPPDSYNHLLLRTHTTMTKGIALNELN